MKKPNLFILGAPKCGTTTIASWLAQHPQVYFSPEKEPHHFYSPYGHTMARETYDALFESAGPAHKILAEASVWYLLGKNTVQKILKYSADAKFIVCLRNPIDMAVSLHAHTVFIGRERIISFDDAWSLSEEREAGSYSGIFGFDQGDPLCMAYKKVCMLGEQVDNILGNLDRERVLFVLLDDLRNNPAQTWAEIQGFLDIKSCSEIDFSSQNQAKRRKFIQLQRFTLFVQNLKRRLGIKKRFGLLSFFNRRNIVREKYPEPSEETRRLMEEAFAPDINRLSRLVNRDLSSWLD